MKKVERLIALIYLLKRYKHLRAKEIAHHLGITERTVYRDIFSLNEAFQDYVRIICTEQGYYLDPTIYAPPLHFISEEIQALQTAVESLPENSPQFQLAHQALSKLMSQKNISLDPDKIQERLAIMPPAPKDKISPQKLNALEHALTEKKLLNIDYFSLNSNKTKAIIFAPYAMLFRKHAWYLLGKSKDHQDLILLKAYRIKHFSLTTETYEIPSSFTVHDYFKNHWEVFDGQAEPIQLRFYGATATLIEEMSWHPSQKIKHQTADSLDLFLTVPLNPEIITWILGWGSHCEVLGPDKLREQVAEESQRLCQLYSRH